MRENILKCNQQGINLQNIQAAHTAQYKKRKNNPFKRISERNRHFSKKIYRWLNTHEKMPNIINY